MLSLSYYILTLWIGVSQQPELSCYRKWFFYDSLTFKTDLEPEVEREGFGSRIFCRSASVLTMQFSALRSWIKLVELSWGEVSLNSFITFHLHVSASRSPRRHWGDATVFKEEMLPTISAAEVSAVDACVWWRQDFVQCSCNIVCGVSTSPQR